MIRLERFVMSRNPYAVDLSSFRVETFPIIFNGVQTGEAHKGLVDAAWFRKKGGRIDAAIGYLWGYAGRDKPTFTDVGDFLDRWDGRYGGEWLAKWDGAKYWAPGGGSTPAGMEADLALLEPMLAGFPDPPAGYDGWWAQKRMSDL